MAVLVLTWVAWKAFCVKVKDRNKTDWGWKASDTSSLQQHRFGGRSFLKEKNNKIQAVVARAYF